MHPRAFFCALFLAPQLAAAASGQFCVQTFNIYGTAYAASVRWRLAELATEIQRAPCAVTQFQEFWRPADYRNFRAYLPRLEFRHSGEIQKASNVGLASAFRGEILGAALELFKVNNEDSPLDWARTLLGVQKGFTLIDAKISGGPRALFVNVHTHPTDPIIRLAQIGQLTERLLAAPPALPIIFNGDLNATPDSPEMALLRDVLLLRDTYLEAHASYGRACTYCGNNPLSWSSEDRVIDFVLVRNSAILEWATLGSEINLRGGAEPLSDHYGVRSDLGWNDRIAVAYHPLDPRVKARMEKAGHALSLAEKILSARAERHYQNMAERFYVLGRELELGNLPPALHHFLIP